LLKDEKAVEQNAEPQIELLPNGGARPRKTVNELLSQMRLKDEAKSAAESFQM
jgi:hypothetical protein